MEKKRSIPKFKTTHELTEFLKKELSLPEFMMEFGYEQGKRSCSRYPKMKHPETGEIYVVKKNKEGHYTHFDPTTGDSKKANGKPEGSRGNIFDFLMREQGFSQAEFSKCVPILKQYYETADFERTKGLNGLSYFDPAKESDGSFDIEKEERNIYPLDPKFLEERGIKKETYTHPYFNGTIFKHEKTGTEGQKIYNTCFMLYSDKSKHSKGWDSVSLRNTKFKGFLKNTERRGMWISKGRENTDRYYIMEQGLDCLSHFQLNREKLDGLNVRYFSTEGTPCEGQKDLFLRQCERQPPKEIYIATDNDKAGELYATQILGMLPGSGGVLKDCMLDASLNKKDGCGLLKIRSEQTGAELDKFKEDLSGLVVSLNSKHGENGKAAPFKLIPYEMPGGDLCNSYAVQYPNDKKHSRIIRAVVQRERHQNSRTVFRELSEKTDFNDDLRAGLKQEKKNENSKGISL